MVRRGQTAIDWVIDIFAMIGVAIVLSFVTQCIAAGNPPQAPSVIPQAPACKDVHEKSEWQQFYEIALRMEEPVLIWMNYDYPYSRTTLSGFRHWVNKRRVKFKVGKGIYDGHVGVLLMETKKSKDGKKYLSLVKAIPAKKCSTEYINTLWDKHSGVNAYKSNKQYKGGQYQAQPMMQMQMYSPTMMQGGYGNSGMMYQSAPGQTRRFSGRCST